MKLVRGMGLVNEVSIPCRFRRRFGVPEGGPIDLFAFQIATEILGQTNAWELLGASATFEAESDCLLAFVGANCKMEIDGEVLRGSRVSTVRAGQHVRLGANCGYVSQSVGIDGPIDLKIDEGWIAPSDPIRAIAGQFDLPTSPLTIHHASNRLGFRLDGWPAFDLPERTSEPCCVGAIQSTPSGQLIVIGPDGPTIGGYPVIGFVTQSHLGRLARRPIGAQIQLEWVSPEQAQANLDQAQRMCRELINLVQIAIRAAMG